MEYEPISSPDLRGLRALIADDSEVDAMAASCILEKCGAAVDVARDGKKALELFASSPVGYYGIVLLDIRMPVMDGREAAESIRSLCRLDAGMIPIAAITSEEPDAMAGAAGINMFLRKPVEPGDVYAALRELLHI